MDRRRFLTAASATGAGVIGARWLTACTSADDASTSIPEGIDPTVPDGVLAAPGSAGLMDEAAFSARTLEYLAFATEELDPSSITNVGAHLALAHRDDTFEWDSTEVTVDSLADTFQFLDDWKDTGDFRLMYLHWLVHLGSGDTAATSLSPDVLDRIRRAMLSFRYRYDDPMPEDRVDHKWFWSENHRIIFLVNEYLAGQRFPDDVFEITGLTGKEHLARSRQPILDWIAERGRFGFFEWHSNVYMLKNIAPLVTLAEQADDAELVAAAAVGLDLSLFDVAAHQHHGCYGATRGRTYKKDKMSGRDEATFGTAKMLFAVTDAPYTSRSDTGATYLAAASRYRPPAVLAEIANWPDVAIIEERHGVDLNVAEPLSESPEVPFGYDFDDPANLPFWWSLGAVAAWQMARTSLAEGDKHRLWDGDLFVQIKLLAELNGRDPERIRQWELDNRAIVNFGYLGEVNTYTWRSPEVMMSTAVDHRPGQLRDQIHSWQATLGIDALVFTTHPTTEPDESTEWRDDPDPGYWTGEAATPRSAQFERTSIHLYLPDYDEATDPLLWSVFGYRDYTHAYFPQDHFDEVGMSGRWVLGRSGDGFVALWSWRQPEWRIYDPAVTATRDMETPFDLVAPGGPDNVWVCEVGRAADHGSFAEFAAAVTATDPEIVRDDQGFSVRWTSPSSGALEFSNSGPFVVDGVEIPLSDYPRHRSVWGETERLDPTLDVAAGDASMTIDLASSTRSVS